VQDRIFKIVKSIDVVAQWDGPLHEKFVEKMDKLSEMFRNTSKPAFTNLNKNQATVEKPKEVVKIPADLKNKILKI
jgi:Na+/phosphate symporter